MAGYKQRLAYFCWSLRNAGDASRSTCPSCGDSSSQTVARKKLFSALRRCNACRLLFRTPTTNATENASFYQSEYEQGDATDVPSDTALSALLASRFEGTDLDRSDSIRLLRAVGYGVGARIFDFGCSWGYGSWQLQQAGFDVSAYEISRPRSNFAVEKLGVQMAAPSSIEPQSFDVVYSSHVIEHVPSPAKMLAQGMHILRPGGLFVALTPNGSLNYRRANAKSWQSSWGQVHPQLICEEWVKRAAGDRPYYISGLPADLSALSRWSDEQQIDGDLRQPHLFFAIRNC